MFRPSRVSPYYYLVMFDTLEGNVDRVGIEPTDNCLQGSQEPQLNHSPFSFWRPVSEFNRLNLVLQTSALRIRPTGHNFCVRSHSFTRVNTPSLLGPSANEPFNFYTEVYSFTRVSHLEPLGFSVQQT